MKPERIVLSRRRGFDLQAVSKARNGLPAQSVTRPGAWGNPFSIDDVVAEGALDRAAAQAEAVRRHELWIKGELDNGQTPPALDYVRARLAGKNLACWCRADTPCHADTLIRLANQ